MDVEKLFCGEGGYVFVSHSHHDIATVRTVRNQLEEKGLEPILFYLRSLDNLDGTGVPFLRKLIYDEINAREFFLYLDSENARRSAWVSEELDYVSRTAPQKIRRINIEKSNEEIIREINNMVNRMRIFLSYSRRDTEIAMRIRDALVRRDFRVYTDNDTRPDAAFSNTALTTIADSSIVLALITESSAGSPIVFKELELAYSQQKIILPIIIGDVKMSEELRFIICRMQNRRLPPVPTDEDINKIINDMKLIFN